jgi:F0F1-type ATP synthase delta subunit
MSPYDFNIEDEFKEYKNVGNNKKGQYNYNNYEQWAQYITEKYKDKNSYNLNNFIRFLISRKRYNVNKSHVLGVIIPCIVLVFTFLTNYVMMFYNTYNRINNLNGKIFEYYNKINTINYFKFEEYISNEIININKGIKYINYLFIILLVGTILSFIILIYYYKRVKKKEYFYLDYIDIIKGINNMDSAKVE